MGPAHQNARKNLKWVNCGKTFAKWGKMDEILLNRVISVKNIKIEGKNQNSLNFVLILYVYYEECCCNVPVSVSTPIGARAISLF